jgi:hypothetical protein
MRPILACFLTMISAHLLCAEISLNSTVVHLRNGDSPEWAIFADKVPQGDRLHLAFTLEESSLREALETGEPWTLLIWQSDVKHNWPVELNGERIGALFLMEAPLVHSISVPLKRLVPGENRLSILPPKQEEDILLKDIQLVKAPPDKAFSAALQVSVRSEGEPVPCRITIAHENDTLAALQPFPGQTLALRPGVVYTGNGEAELRILPGNYLVYAGRGFEYGVSTQAVRVARGERQRVELSIEREVPTEGWAACDTHLHTLTLSGHGDSTLEERILTIAGEGIELPVAAEHNRHADYSEAAQALGLDRYFTSIVGNEVTTPKGHFNIFPVDPEARVPDFRIQHWPALMASIRATPQVQVVVLNHPRDVHAGFRPFGPENFNPATGENRRGFEFEFDAVELVNSGALRSDYMEVYRDWFALLNHGYRITGVGSSDSHDVSRYIAGQGRTYVQCDDSDPGNIPVRAALANLLEGRAVVSFGLFPLIEVNGRFGPGELAHGTSEELEVRVRVLGPSWVTADKLELYANGILIRSTNLAATTYGQAPLKAEAAWTIPTPGHDVFLVAIASGPGVTAPFWALARPYQPASLEWTPRVIGSTNPVWVDADGDGAFTPAREYARRLVSSSGNDPGRLLLALKDFDEAVAAQAASFQFANKEDLQSQRWAGLIQNAPAHVRSGFSRFIRTLDPEKK